MPTSSRATTRTSLSCVLGLTLSLGITPVEAATQGASLLDRLVAVETGCDAICPPADTAPELRAQVSRLVDRVREKMRRTRDPRARVEALSRFIFDHLGVQASRDLTDPDNLFLSRVLERKQGYCVGIASLYLVLADELDLPLFAVATPSHVFLRYDDGEIRFNIETFQNGAQLTDEEYTREYAIPEASIEKGVFLRNLEPEEFLAQVHNNLGVIYSRRKDFKNAASQYEQAIRLDRKLAAAYYNHGNDLLKQGVYRKATRRFSKSLRLYPTDAWALNNRGLAYLKRGKLKKARRDFEQALKVQPGFEAARKNLESLTAGSQSP
jgi:regulator of sirC expression with transglutaminase-like and TPR domain